MKIKPDIYASIYLYHSEYGGRKSPASFEYLGCPIKFEKSTKQGFDCRIYLDNVGSICPGEIKFQLPIKFLSWDLVKPLLSVGTKFYLWEAKFFGEGIVEVIEPSEKDFDKQVDIAVLKFRLHAVIDSLIKLLEIHSEDNWKNSFITVLNEIANNDNLKQIARIPLSWYGGMGSFNDLVLHKDGKPLIEENNILASLKESLHKTCVEIITYPN